MLVTRTASSTMLLIGSGQRGSVSRRQLHRALRSLAQEEALFRQARPNTVTIEKDIDAALAKVKCKEQGAKEKPEPEGGQDKAKAGTRRETFRGCRLPYQSRQQYLGSNPDVATLEVLPNAIRPGLFPDCFSSPFPCLPVISPLLLV